MSGSPIIRNGKAKAGKLFNKEIAIGVNLNLEEVQELAEEILEVVMAK